MKHIEHLISKVNQTNVTTGETPKYSTGVNSHTTKAPSISAALTNSAAPSIYTIPYVSITTTPKVIQRDVTTGETSNNSPDVDSHTTTAA